MTPQESRKIVVSALRWSRAHERRREGQSARLLRRRERELLRVCARACDGSAEQPSMWRRLVDIVLGTHRQADRILVGGDQ
jgi:hypothetical protein